MKKKMLKILFVNVIGFCLLQSHSFAQNKNANESVEKRNRDKRRLTLIQIIDEEINELTRLRRQLHKDDPDFLIRTSEAYLEKARLIKEEENERFLSMNPNQRNKISRDYFFRNSTSFFQKSQQHALDIIEKFPQYKSRGEVFYILAFNSKEFNRPDAAKKYFEQAIRFARKRDTKVKSIIALANMLFNENQFAKAKEYYSRVIPNDRSSKWWTKEAYNYAWCFYKLKEYAPAIDYLKQVYNLSKRPEYLDMSEAARRDLGLFYGEANRVDEGIDFLKTILAPNEVNGEILLMSRRLIDRGQNASARRLILAILQNKHGSTVTKEERVEALFLLLKIYDVTSNYNAHLETAKQIYGIYSKEGLTKERLEELRYSLNKLSAYLQNYLVKTEDGISEAKKKSLAALLSEYFELLGQTNKEAGYKALFLKGETYFSIKDYASALQSYDDAYQKAEMAKDIKFQKTILEASLASLGKVEGNKGLERKYLLINYYRYLNLYPRSNKSKQIYQKAFNIEFERKNLEGAERIFNLFKIAYPRDSKIQEGMLAKILEEYQKKKDLRKLNYWQNRIQTERIPLSRSLKDQLNKVILTLQFEGVEKTSSKGLKAKAIQGYFTIFNDPKSSKDAKKNAAYNIAILYYEGGSGKNSMNWAMKALDLMNQKEVVKFSSSFMTIFIDLFERQEFSDAIKLGDELLQKMCFSKTSVKETLAKNLILLDLANRSDVMAKRHINWAKKCKINNKIIVDSEVELATFYLQQERWQELGSLVRRLEKNRMLQGQMIFFADRMRNVYKKAGQPLLESQFESKMMRYYKNAKQYKAPIPLNSLDVIARIEIKKLKQEVKKLNAIKLRFDEKVFNAQLEKKFKQLDVITSKGLSIIELGSARGIVRSYRLLIIAYENLVKDIKNFTPPNKPKEYVEGFKKTMLSVTNPVSKKAKEFKVSARKELSRLGVLTKNSSWFFSRINTPFYLRFENIRQSVLMDRTGANQL